MIVNLKTLFSTAALVFVCSLNSGCFLALAGGAGYVVGKKHEKNSAQTPTTANTSQKTNNTKSPSTT